MKIDRAICNERKTMKLYYLASPYTHSDPKVMQERFEQVCAVAGKLFNLGIMVYSPIAHCHHIALGTKLPADYAFWLKYNRLLLSKCDGLVVVSIEGYEKSAGIRAELAIAHELKIPVYLVYPYDSEAVFKALLDPSSCEPGQPLHLFEP